MKLSNLLVINAIVAIIYGISFVLAPVTLLSLYCMTQGPNEALSGQDSG